MNVINSSSTFSIPSQFSSSSHPTSEAVALCVLSGQQYCSRLEGGESGTAFQILANIVDFWWIRINII
jgi:hypothetical protein